MPISLQRHHVMNAHVLSFQSGAEHTESCSPKETPGRSKEGIWGWGVGGEASSAVSLNCPSEGEEERYGLVYLRSFLTLLSTAESAPVDWVHQKTLGSSIRFCLTFQEPQRGLEAAFSFGDPSPLNPCSHHPQSELAPAANGFFSEAQAAKPSNMAPLLAPPLVPGPVSVWARHGKARGGQEMCLFWALCQLASCDLDFGF